MARYAVTQRHVGTTVEHRPKIGDPWQGKLVRFEKRGQYELALIEFPGHRWWVDRAELHLVDGKGKA